MPSQPGIGISMPEFVSFVCVKVGIFSGSGVDVRGKEVNVGSIVSCKDSVGDSTCVADEHAEIIKASKIIVANRGFISSILSLEHFALASQQPALVRCARCY